MDAARCRAGRDVVLAGWRDELVVGVDPLTERAQFVLFQVLGVDITAEPT